MDREQETIPWHRLLGLTLADFFSGSVYKVEVERDLSTRRQLLDVIIIEQTEGEPPAELPDGLDNLRKHNLLTFKSHHETLDAWVIDELVGHYVNYRKQLSPASENLAPADDFQLYAIAGRHPSKLEREVVVAPMHRGVYETRWGAHVIRILVTSEMPRIGRNALWQLFSGQPDGMEFGYHHYRWRRPDLSAVVTLLSTMEGCSMPYTVEDFKRDYRAILLRSLSVEERLEGLGPEERLRGLSLGEIEEYVRRMREKRESEPEGNGQ